VVSAALSRVVDTCFNLAEKDHLIQPDDSEVLELFTLQVALAEMWMAWGIRPAALAGHSFGENVTLVIAGVLSLQDALKLIGIHASLIRERCTETPSKMAAVYLPLPEI
jgi:acyl transferase domain-containing protein